MVFMTRSSFDFTPAEILFLYLENGCLDIEKEILIESKFGQFTFEDLSLDLIN